MNETLHWADLQDAGNAQAQLVLYAIARHANWTTGECFPKQEDLARMAKCTDRTVRTYLKVLEDQGLIERSVRTREDGGKTSDLIRLKGFAEWVQALRTGGRVSAPKAAPTPPENISDTPGSVASSPPGKQASAPPGKQVSGLIDELSKEQSIEPSAPERASDKGARAPVAPKPVAAVSIRQGESAFAAWIEHLKKIGRDDLATDARDAGEMLVSRRWPNEGDLPLSIPQPKGLSDVSKRIMGDAA